MAGKHQHYIPRLLLRGFLSRIKKKKKKNEEFAYVYHKNRHPYEINIMKIAAEDAFYESSKFSADNIMTEREKKYGLAVNCARRNKAISEDILSDVVAFVSSMVMRTKYTRDGLEGSLRYFVEKAEQSVLSDHFVDPFIDKTLTDDFILSGVVDELEKIMPGVPRDALQTFALQKIAEQQDAIDKIIEVGKAKVACYVKGAGDHVFSELKKKVQPIVKEKHVEIQAIDEVDVKRNDDYKKLCWSVVEYDEGSLILGDVGPMCINVDGELVPPLFGGNVYRLLLPLSSGLLLVGGCDDSGVCFSANEINMMSASMSMEFFVSSCRCDNIDRCQGVIGVKAMTVFKDDVDKAVGKELGFYGRRVVH